MGLLGRCVSEDENLEEMGDGCFMSHKGEGNREGKRILTVQLGGMEMLAQPLWTYSMFSSKKKTDTQLWSDYHSDIRSHYYKPYIMVKTCPFTLYLFIFIVKIIL